MKLKGIIDFSLGNFLCLRGFAPMGVLQDISIADENYQRVPKKERLKGIEDFLKKGENVFFPEVILCISFIDEYWEPEQTDTLYTNIRQGKAFRSLDFGNGIRMSSTVTRSQKAEDIRAVQFFQTATIEVDDERGISFSRIDGNHRLEATKDPKVRDYITPYCIVFCRNIDEYHLYCRVLFHNINYKQVPLLKEHNLSLILNDQSLFSDEKLKSDPSFGWSYYLARQLNHKLDFDLLPNLKPLIEKEPYSFLVDQFGFLLEKKVLGNNENAISRFKEALVRVNALFESHPSLKESPNIGLLATLVYYELKTAFPIPSFVRWVLDNNIHMIKELNSTDLIGIFGRILESRRRTIFVSMKFKKDSTEGHYKTIQRVCKEVTNAYNLKPELKVQRVDWFDDGTSYDINDKIIDMICDCGLLIGDLTFCNPNVYHEIGFVMGKAKAEGKNTANMLLIIDESVADERDKFVGFNLRNIKHLSFKNNEELGRCLIKISKNISD